MLGSIYSADRFPELTCGARDASCSPFLSEESAVSAHRKGVDVYVEDKGYFYKLTEKGVRRNWKRAWVVYLSAQYVDPFIRDTTTEGQMKQKAKIFEAFDPSI